MNYLEAIFTVTPRDPWTDLLIDGLADLGFESFEETEEGCKAYMEGTELSGDLREGIEKLRESTYHFQYHVESLGSKNWNEEWEKNFHPVWVDGGCLIRAPFHQPAKTGMELVIMPRMSFGTGHHASTWLMIAEMLQLDFKGKMVLDMGCGTGILAILAAKLQAAEVLAIDNYPHAIENALDNIAENQVTTVKPETGDHDRLENRCFDYILANINRNTLLENLPLYAASLPDGGSLLTSGFLVKDLLEMFSKAHENHLELVGLREKQNWVMARFVKIPD